MKRISPRERNLAIVTLVVVGVALVWTQLLDPAWSSWKLKSSLASVLEQSNQRARAQREKLPKLREELLTMEESLLPPAGTTLQAWILRHLEETGSEARFVPSSLRYLRADPIEDSAYAELRFELRAQATPEQLQSFLVRLAASPRHVRVVALGLVPRKRDAGQLDVNLTLVALASRVALDD